jgi:hypothetical protein
MANARDAAQGGLDEAEALLRSASLAFEVARDALEDRARGLRDGDEKGQGAELGALLKETARALTVAVEQARKVADQKEKADGGGGLDLDAARIEVRRRLAGMRDARDVGPLHGGPDGGGGPGAPLAVGVLGAAPSAAAGDG